MEAADDQTTALAGGTPTDITNVAKGKRTKRQRPQSPIRFSFSPNNNNDLTSSPLSSSGFRAGSITAEDEDTAESLILLSRGQSSLDMKKHKDDYDGAFKFNSKRYIQSPVTGAGGVYVYECKTCSRTFPSFQALGGHRASHKKPRNNDDIRKPPQYTAVMDTNEPPPPEFLSRNDYYYSSSSSLSFQLNNRGPLIGNTMKSSSSRLHECSICGTEFNSGQALGGHMRRHRVAGGRNKGENGIGATTSLSLIPVEVCDRKLAKDDDALCLGLDLNLPAPTAAGGNDDQRHKLSGGGFSPAGENESKQPPAVHFSTAPTLVDCHY